MDKVSSLKNLFSRMFGGSVEGDTICEVLDNVSTQKEIILASSTPDSTKKFKITVVDNGTISASEITST